MNLTGNLIIAPPAVKGNFWYKTVIMVTENHNNGSIGLILNKRSNMTVADLGDKLGYDVDIDDFVYIGGPISKQSLSLLHSNEWKCKNTMRINNKFSISSADDIFPRFAKYDMPEHWRMFVGICGWAPRQLENEIAGVEPYTHKESWCTASSSEELVYFSDGKEQWWNSLEQSGMEFARGILA